MHLYYNFSIAAHERGYFEGIYLGVMMYIYTIAFLVGVTVGFALNNNPVVQYATISALILLCSQTTTSLMLVPKVNGRMYLFIENSK